MFPTEELVFIFRVVGILAIIGLIAIAVTFLGGIAWVVSWLF